MMFGCLIQNSADILLLDLVRVFDGKVCFCIITADDLSFRGCKLDRLSDILRCRICLRVRLVVFGYLLGRILFGSVFHCS